VLNQLLREGADAHPDKPLVVGAARTTTWGECAARAAALASGLDRRGITRFACLVGDVADLLALLAGSSAVPAEACMYPTSTPADEAARLAAHFDHGVIVTDRPDRWDGLALDELASDGDDGGSRNVRSLMADSAINDRTLARGSVFARDPAQAPVLILTTGTTGLPKGARNDWVRLVTAHRRRVGPGDARWLLAHVPNQFAGLGVVLHCLVSGATLVVPAAHQPRESLAAMREHGVTHVSATPTFWRFLLGLCGKGGAADLPLRQITIAGEAVPAALLDDLYAAFPDARITQIYGATEFGSSVAVGDARNGLPLSVLDRGDDADVQFRIVDGELQVRSRIGMLGYYGSDDVGDAWRPTGDLVEVRGDRIHFAGRASETINVGGVKVHPLPIEDLVDGVDGVELAHVYGRSSPVAGQIVAVDVVLSSGADRDTVEDAIRAACESLPPAAQPRRIRFVDDLDIRDTKIARRRPEQS
jgi:acyl-CoA synthetase (AMP-forming)/AMP-acid ligase II